MERAALVAYLVAAVAGAVAFELDPDVARAVAWGVWRLAGAAVDGYVLGYVLGALHADEERLEPLRPDRRHPPTR